MGRICALAVAVLACVRTATSQELRLSLQTCSGTLGAEELVVNGDGTITQGSGRCVGFDATSLLIVACTGTADQRFSFRADGTVQSASQTSQCWNAIGGGTSIGTTVGMYSCGTREVAANDVFWPLPSQRRILANESGLCVSSAAPPPPPCDDRCCSLNGAWSAASQSCACYAPWMGTNCSTLDVRPVPPVQGYGMAPNLTSWGGNIAATPDGAHHLFVAEMVNHCTLASWGSNSQCTHAVSLTGPEGPYLFHDTALPVW